MRGRLKRKDPLFLLPSQRVLLPMRFMYEKRRLGIIIVLALIMTVIPFRQFAWVERIEAWTMDGVTPLIQAISIPVGAIQRWAQRPLALVDVIDKMERLQAENTALQQRVNRQDYLTMENQELRALSQLPIAPSRRFISALVVADIHAPFEKSLLIGVGKVHGVRRRQAVVSDQGLVGQIIALGKRSSRVLLLTDFNSRIPIITGQSQSQAILVGDGGGEPILRYMEDISPAEGEVVFTSGRGGFFMPGIVIGHVVQDRDIGLYRVRLAVPSSQARLVRVLPHTGIDPL